MRKLHKTKSQIFALIAPLAFALGCGETTDDAIWCSNAAECDAMQANWTTGFSATLKATLPEGVVGDFRLGRTFDGGDPLPCEGVNECVVEFDLPVRAYTERRLFIKSPRHMLVHRDVVLENNGDSLEFTWTTPGSWGLAPQGRYVDENGSKYDVRTFVESAIMIYVVGPHAMVSGDTFMGEDDSRKVNGAIAEDLSTIKYKYVVPGAMFEGTLTRVP